MPARRTVRVSRTPDLPERYVCESCHAVYAGTVVDSDGETHEFAAPDQCAACGSTMFVPIEQYTYEMK